MVNLSFRTRAKVLSGPWEMHDLLVVGLPREMNL